MTEPSDSNGTGEASGDQIASCRDGPVDQLIGNGTIVSDAVANAMRTVPRHLFIPEVSPKEACRSVRPICRALMG